ncbi:MAG: hypothetical protein LBK13_13240 [Spirochaetales bacterium]|jgi:hypothetical protein|nr:hypothetical protein [Spirochaetales bacterium]
MKYRISIILLHYRNLGAFFAVREFAPQIPKPQKTGLSASIFWLRQKDFRSNPVRRAASEFAECKFAATPLPCAPRILPDIEQALSRVSSKEL